MVTKNFLTPSLLILMKSDMVSWLWSWVIVSQVSSFSVLFSYNYNLITITCRTDFKVY